MDILNNLTKFQNFILDEVQDGITLLNIKKLNTWLKHINDNHEYFTVENQAQISNICLNYIKCLILFYGMKDYICQPILKGYLEDVVSLYTNHPIIHNETLKLISVPVFDIIMDPSVPFFCGYEMVKAYISILQASTKSMRDSIFSKGNRIYTWKIMDHLFICGDYDYQVALLELLFRICPDIGETETSKELIPDSNELQKHLGEIRLSHFDHDSRYFLNQVNLFNTNIFSIEADLVLVGKQKIAAPNDFKNSNSLWIDFNRQSLSINVQCASDSMLTEAPLTPNDGWEMLYMHTSIIDKITIKNLPTKRQGKANVLLVIELNDQIKVCFDTSYKLVRTAKSVKIMLKDDDSLQILVESYLPQIFGDKFDAVLRNCKENCKKKVSIKPLNICVTKSKFKKTYSTGVTSVKSMTSAVISPTTNSSIPENAEICKTNAIQQEDFSEYFTCPDPFEQNLNNIHKTMSLSKSLPVEIKPIRSPVKIVNTTANTTKSAYFPSDSNKILIAINEHNKIKKNLNDAYANQNEPTCGRESLKLRMPIKVRRNVSRASNLDSISEDEEGAYNSEIKSRVDDYSVFVENIPNDMSSPIVTDIRTINTLTKRENTLLAVRKKIIENISKVKKLPVRNVFVAKLNPIIQSEETSKKTKSEVEINENKLGNEEFDILKYLVSGNEAVQEIFSKSRNQHDTNIKEIHKRNILSVIEDNIPCSNGLIKEVMETDTKEVSTKGLELKEENFDKACISAPISGLDELKPKRQKKNYEEELIGLKCEDEANANTNIVVDKVKADDSKTKTKKIPNVDFTNILSARKPVLEDITKISTRLHKQLLENANSDNTKPIIIKPKKQQKSLKKNHKEESIAATNYENEIILNTNDTVNIILPNSIVEELKIAGMTNNLSAPELTETRLEKDTSQVSTKRHTRSMKDKYSNDKENMTFISGVEKLIVNPKMQKKSLKKNHQEELISATDYENESKLNTNDAVNTVSANSLIEKVQMAVVTNNFSSQELAETGLEVHTDKASTKLQKQLMEDQDSKDENYTTLISSVKEILVKPKKPKKSLKKNRKEESATNYENEIILNTNDTVNIVSTNSLMEEIPKAGFTMNSTAQESAETRLEVYTDIASTQLQKHLTEDQNSKDDDNIALISGVKEILVKPKKQKKYLKKNRKEESAAKYENEIILNTNDTVNIVSANSLIEEIQMAGVKNNFSAQELTETGLEVDTDKDSPKLQKQLTEDRNSQHKDDATVISGVKEMQLNLKKQKKSSKRNRKEVSATKYENEVILNTNDTINIVSANSLMKEIPKAGLTMNSSAQKLAEFGLEVDTDEASTKLQKQLTEEQFYQYKDNTTLISGVKEIPGKPKKQMRSLKRNRKEESATNYENEIILNTDDALHIVSANSLMEEMPKAGFTMNSTAQELAETGLEVDPDKASAKLQKHLMEDQHSKDEDNKTLISGVKEILGKPKKQKKSLKKNRKEESATNYENKMIINTNDTLKIVLAQELTKTGLELGTEKTSTILQKQLTEDQNSKDEDNRTLISGVKDIIVKPKKQKSLKRNCKELATNYENEILLNKNDPVSMVSENSIIEESQVAGLTNNFFTQELTETRLERSTDNVLANSQRMEDEHSKYKENTKFISGIEKIKVKPKKQKSLKKNHKEDLILATNYENEIALKRNDTANIVPENSLIEKIQITGLKNNFSVQELTETRLEKNANNVLTKLNSQLMEDESSNDKENSTFIPGVEKILAKPKKFLEKNQKELISANNNEDEMKLNTNDTTNIVLANSSIEGIQMAGVKNISSAQEFAGTGLEVDTDQALTKPYKHSIEDNTTFISGVEEIIEKPKKQKKNLKKELIEAKNYENEIILDTNTKHIVSTNSSIDEIQMAGVTNNSSAPALTEFQLEKDINMVSTKLTEQLLDELNSKDKMHPQFDEEMLMNFKPLRKPLTKICKEKLMVTNKSEDKVEENTTDNLELFKTKNVKNKRRPILKKSKTMKQGKKDISSLNKIKPVAPKNVKKSSKKSKNENVLEDGNFDTALDVCSYDVKTGTGTDALSKTFEGNSKAAEIIVSQESKDSHQLIIDEGNNEQINLSSEKASMNKSEIRKRKTKKCNIDETEFENFCIQNMFNESAKKEEPRKKPSLRKELSGKSMSDLIVDKHFLFDENKETKILGDEKPEQNTSNAEYKLQLSKNIINMMDVQPSIEFSNEILKADQLEEIHSTRRNRRCTKKTKYQVDSDVSSEGLHDDDDLFEMSTQELSQNQSNEQQIPTDSHINKPLVAETATSCSQIVSSEIIQNDISVPLDNVPIVSTEIQHNNSDTPIVKDDDIPQNLTNISENYVSNLEQDEEPDMNSNISMMDLETRSTKSIASSEISMIAAQRYKDLMAIKYNKRKQRLMCDRLSQSDCNLAWPQPEIKKKSGFRKLYNPNDLSYISNMDFTYNNETETSVKDNSVSHNQIQKDIQSVNNLEIKQTNFNEFETTKIENIVTKKQSISKTRKNKSNYNIKNIADIKLNKVGNVMENEKVKPKPKRKYTRKSKEIEIIDNKIESDDIFDDILNAQAKLSNPFNSRKREAETFLEEPNSKKFKRTIADDSANIDQPSLGQLQPSLGQLLFFGALSNIEKKDERNKSSFAKYKARTSKDYPKNISTKSSYDAERNTSLIDDDRFESFYQERDTPLKDSDRFDNIYAELNRFKHGFKRNIRDEKEKYHRCKFLIEEVRKIQMNHQ